MILSDTLSAPVELEGGVDAAFVWLTIHSSSRFWKETYAGEFLGTGGDQAKAYKVLEYSRESAGRLSLFPAARWKFLCDGLGWTPLGCGLWSWCEGIDLRSILEAVRRLGWQPDSNPGQDFAALLMNPAILPANKLSDIIRAGHDVHGVCLLLAARLEPPELDVPSEVLAGTPMILKSMLRVRGLDLDLD